MSFIDPPGRDDGLPFTIPWPKKTTEAMIAMGLIVRAGSELFARISSRPERLGWDAKAQTWAGIRIGEDETLPPRALSVLRAAIPGVSRAVVLSLIEDMDNPEDSRKVSLPEVIE